MVAAAIGQAAASPAAGTAATSPAAAAAGPPGSTAAGSGVAGAALAGAAAAGALSGVVAAAASARLMHAFFRDGIPASYGWRAMLCSARLLDAGDAPPWRKFRSVTVDYLPSGIGTDNNTSRLKIGDKPEDDVKLASVWVRRVNRVGTPFWLHFVFTVLATALAAAIKGVMYLKEWKNVVGSPISPEVNRLLAWLSMLLPAVSMFVLLLKASLNAQDGAFTGRIPLPHCCGCCAPCWRRFSPCPSRCCAATTASALVSDDDMRLGHCRRLKPGLGLASTVFWRNFVIWALCFAATGLYAFIARGGLENWNGPAANTVFGCFVAINAAVSAVLFSTVPTAGYAIALIPRPTPERTVTPAPSIAATTGTGIGADESGADSEPPAPAAPLGTRFLLFATAAEAQAWERNLAHASCNGVIGVSTRVLAALAVVSETDAADYRMKKLSYYRDQSRNEHSGTADADRETARTAATAPFTTANVNYFMTKPACEEAATPDKPMESFYDMFGTPEQRASAITRRYADLVRRCAHAGHLLQPPQRCQCAGDAGHLLERCAAAGFRITDDDFGPATSFLSHAWDSPFPRLVQLLKAHDRRLYLQRARFNLWTIGFNVQMWTTGCMQELPLLSDRERRSWVDIICKKQPTAGGPRPDAAELARRMQRNSELIALLADPRSGTGGTPSLCFRLDEAATEYPRQPAVAGGIDDDELGVLNGYSAGTMKEFKRCIGGPGVVDAVFNSAVLRTRQQPAGLTAAHGNGAAAVLPPSAKPDITDRVWCLYEAFEGARPGRIYNVVRDAAAEASAAMTDSVIDNLRMQDANASEALDVFAIFRTIRLELSFNKVNESVRAAFRAAAKRNTQIDRAVELHRLQSGMLALWAALIAVSLSVAWPVLLHKVLWEQGYYAPNADNLVTGDNHLFYIWLPLSVLIAVALLTFHEAMRALFGPTWLLAAVHWLTARMRQCTSCCCCGCRNRSTPLATTPSEPGATSKPAAPDAHL